MIKRFVITSLALTLALWSFLSSPVSAHVLKTDGTIGAILHINPDDNPMSGTPTSYILAFTDTSSQFALTKCNCTVAIQENSKILSAQPLALTDPLDSENTFTFPNADVYNLQVSGQPKEPHAFQPFVLNYLVRVSGGPSANNAQPFPALLWVGLTMMIGLILLGAYKSEHNVQER